MKYGDGSAATWKVKAALNDGMDSGFEIVGESATARVNELYVRVRTNNPVGDGAGLVKVTFEQIGR